MYSSSRFLGSLAGMAFSLAFCFLSSGPMRAQGMPQFQQTYMVPLQEPVILNVDIKNGQLQILYSRDGKVSLSVSVSGSLEAWAKTDSSVSPLIEQKGNSISIRVPDASHEQRCRTLLYRLDVPYRTEVVSHVGTGKQQISGIMGPVRSVTESGDTRVSYISQDVAATVGDGNLDLDVIGGRIQAQVHRGNISCVRAAHLRARAILIGPFTAVASE